MPRPASAIGADGLPLWDTFEASFFLIAGLFIGVVLGVLFPSLWRSLRRRFRNTQKYAPDESNLGGSLRSPLRIFEDDSEDELQNLEGGALTVSQAFVTARSLVQSGRSREAIQVYLDILGFEQISKKQTNRALFELSQTYQSLGLGNKAFDTALELLYRKPEHTLVMEHLVQLCLRFSFFEKLPPALEVFKGNPDTRTRLLICHALCEAGERALDDGNRRLALEHARNASRWSLLSGRAKVLLWKVTSQDLWEHSGKDASSAWTALAADLEARWQIEQDTGVSAAAGSDYLAELVANLAASQKDQIEFNFAHIFPEFQKITGRSRMTPEQTSKNEWLGVFAAAHLMQDTAYLQTPYVRCVLTKLSPTLVSLLFNNETQQSSLKTKFLASGLNLHKCNVCKTFVAQFEWMCHVCGSPESYQPWNGQLPKVEATKH